MPDKMTRLVVFAFILSDIFCGFHLDNLKLFQQETSLPEILQEYNMSVDGSQYLGKLDRFWRSTGVCPPDPHQDAFKFFLSKDFDLNLALLSSLPNSGITHVRMHWLLNLVQMRINPDGSKHYDFTYLDELIAKLWRYDLFVGFELMGNPSQLFTDFENPTQIFWWRDLVQDLALHYIGLYGETYVISWNFETWNEPDHHDFDGLNFTVQGFLNYYDACSEGLLSANKLLKFGGPGGSCHLPNSGHSPICWALLKHCMSGINYFTGDVGVRLDFISFHKKGNGSSLQVLLEEVETLKFIQNKFPKLAHLPIFNDEADPLKNWSLSKWWRADATYAAIVAKVIVGHAYFYYSSLYATKYRFGLLSNDNGFLSYYPNQFTERTLLARFQINNTIHKHVQFIRKPVYSTMGLLSQLCEEILEIKLHSGDTFFTAATETVGALATRCMRDEGHIAVLLYNSADVKDHIGIAHINLTIKNVSFNASDVKWALYNVNNVYTNPYEIWNDIGHPAFPSLSEFSYIKSFEEPILKRVATLKPPWHFDIILLRPGISLLKICPKGSPPVEVSKLLVLGVSDNSVQLIWRDKVNRCVLTYNIEYSHQIYGPYMKLNKNYVTFNSYWHFCSSRNPDCQIQGYYRVQVVDYWNISGPYTAPIKFN